MNNHHSLDARTRRAERRPDGGFTLVEILIAMVLIGILSAVVVVGISNLTSKGSSSACAASADAAKAGAIVYYSTHNNTYPATLTDLVTPVTTGTTIPAALVLPSGVTASSLAMVTSGASWTLTMTPGVAGAAPTFACTVP
jgi:prepilin-type N-terminal cleavage/methylation domain-containing protein